MANETTFVTVGANAQSFHDPTTGITVVKGQKVELTVQQMKAPRVQLALNAGHLVRVHVEVADEVNKYSDKEVSKAISRAKKMFKEGATIDKITGNFNHDLILAMAVKAGVESEEGDTDNDLIDAIVTD